MIRSIRDLYRMMRYNEKKVDTGNARFLLAANYATPDTELTARQKLRRLQIQASLNHRASLTSISAKLFLDPSEQPDADLMSRLANIYMERMGFAEQPYLVYQHTDTAVPHLHIISSAIRRDGALIHIDYQKKQLSTNIAESLEKEFDLVRFHTDDWLYLEEGRSLTVDDIHFDQGRKATYVNSIIAKVLTNDHFTSLEEYNILLHPYHLIADKGKPETMTRQNGGLVYRQLGEDGTRIWKYFKSSLLAGKPTLKFLEQRFERDRAEQAARANRIRIAIDRSLAQERDQRLDRLQTDLRLQGIDMHWSEPANPSPADGARQSLFYIDHRDHWAFGEAVMGEDYSAAAILRRSQSPENERKQERGYWPSFSA